MYLSVLSVVSLILFYLQVNVFFFVNSFLKYTTSTHSLKLNVLFGLETVKPDKKRDYEVRKKECNITKHFRKISHLSITQHASHLSDLPTRQLCLPHIKTRKCYKLWSLRREYETRRL